MRFINLFDRIIETAQMVPDALAGFFNGPLGQCVHNISVIFKHCRSAFVVGQAENAQPVHFSLTFFDGLEGHGPATDLADQFVKFVIQPVQKVGIFFLQRRILRRQVFTKDLFGLLRPICAGQLRQLKLNSEAQKPSIFDFTNRKPTVPLSRAVA